MDEPRVVVGFQIGGPNGTQDGEVTFVAGIPVGHPASNDPDLANRTRVTDLVFDVCGPVRFSASVSALVGPPPEAQLTAYLSHGGPGDASCLGSWGTG